jgi:hypothetical protein
MSELMLAPKSRRTLNTDSLEIGDEKREPKGLSEKQWNRIIDDDLKNPKVADRMAPRTNAMMRKYYKMRLKPTSRWVYDIALYRLKFAKVDKTKTRSRRKIKGGSLISSKVFLPTNYMRAWGVSARAFVNAKKELIEKGFLEEVVDSNYWGAAKQYKLLVLPWGLK